MNAARRPSGPIATFLVERYWPGVTVEQFTDAATRLDEAVTRLREGGTAIRTVSSTLVPVDEAAYWVVEAASADLVEVAFRQADVSVERIVGALDGRTAAAWRREPLRPVGPGRPGSVDEFMPGEAAAEIPSASAEGRNEP